MARLRLFNAQQELGAMALTLGPADRSQITPKKAADEGLYAATLVPGYTCPRGTVAAGFTEKRASPTSYRKQTYAKCRPIKPQAPQAAPAQQQYTPPPIVFKPVTTTTISPQISPAIQVTEDSPGASQSSTPISTSSPSVDASEQQGMTSSDFERLLSTTNAQTEERLRREALEREYMQQQLLDNIRKEAALNEQMRQAASQAELNELQQELIRVREAAAQGVEGRIDAPSGPKNPYLPWIIGGTLTAGGLITVAFLSKQADNSDEYRRKKRGP